MVYGELWDKWQGLLVFVPDHLSGRQLLQQVIFSIFWNYDRYGGTAIFTADYPHFAIADLHALPHPQQAE